MFSCGTLLMAVANWIPEAVEILRRETSR